MWLSYELYGCPAPLYIDRPLEKLQARGFFQMDRLWPAFPKPG